MTWIEWVNSSYNKREYSSVMGVFMLSNGIVTDSTGNNKVETIIGDPVAANDKIISNYSYDLASPSGGAN